MRKKFPQIWSHLAAWIAFLAIPSLVMSPSRMPPGPPPPEFMMQEEATRPLFFVLTNVFLICFFYFNYFVLIPRLWTKQLKWPYFASIFGCFLLLQLYVSVFFWIAMPRLAPFTLNDVFHHLGMFASFVMFVLSWAASSGIRLSMEWKKADERRKESENARLNAELLQLKSQLNPHFLFNTLNGIYTLTLAKNEAAPDAVMKLSHLLRYVMAEANADMVPLEHDLEHLRHFIDLHQMRLTAQTPVHFNVEGNPAGQFIAPLLLLPFVENAFKFGSSARELSPIDIAVKITAQQLFFSCRNHIRNQVDDSTGIGISNTRRRLELLYPGHYQLDISTQKEVFLVQLSIDFKQTKP